MDVGQRGARSMSRHRKPRPRGLKGRFHSYPTTTRHLILAVLVGVVAGLGAILFYEALLVSTHFFLHTLAGYDVPTPTGEGNSAGSAGYARPWAIPLVVALGGLISGLVVFTWAPEAEGHGTDAAISAIHHNPRGIRLRTVIVKIIASAVTIGSGGSGGREGPTAQISAGFGSLMARVLDLSEEDARVAVSIGVGSGIGAIFSSPLGGAILASEIIYRDDFEPQALLPGFVASVIAFLVFGSALGFEPIFSIPSIQVFDSPMQLVYFAVLGLIAGLIGVLYSKSFYGVIALNRRLPFTRKLRPALGGLLVGLMALAAPEVLSTGYGWVQKGLSATTLDSIPLALVLLLPFLRIIATSFSIGSGGSGGVFGPGMVIGAFTGAAAWRLGELFLPSMPHSPASFVVVGMMACFGAISRAPIAVMVMVIEMTGNVDALTPAILAVAIATYVVRSFDESIYEAQLHNRAEFLALRKGKGLAY
ncbi:MAG: chloride channel protein [Actinomycetota bacterium]|nr:chloride channel protein [Actinomycetota bacterium]